MVPSSSVMKTVLAEFSLRITWLSNEKFVNSYKSSICLPCSSCQNNFVSSNQHFAFGMQSRRECNFFQEFDRKRSLLYSRKWGAVQGQKSGSRPSPLHSFPLPTPPYGLKGPHILNVLYLRAIARNSFHVPIMYLLHVQL